MENSSSELLNIMSSEVHLWVAVRRHWRVAAVVAGLVFGVIAYKTFRAPGIYKSEALIVVGNQVGVSIIQDTSNREAKDFAKELPTEIEILQSPSLLNKAISQLRSNYGDIHIQDVQSNLSLNQPKDTNVLSVSYQDVDRVRAKNILDKIVATYIQYSEESRRSPFTNAVRFIEKRLPDAKSALEKTSSALTRFRTDHNLDNPDNNVSLAYTSKQELQKQLETAQIELGQLNKREQEIKSQMLRMGQNPATAVPDAALSQEPGRQALLQQLNNLEIQYSLEQSRYTDRNPILQDIKERRDRLRGLLRGKNAGSSTEQKYLTPSKGGATGTIQQDLASQLLQTQINIATQQKLLSDLREQGNRNNLELEKMLRLQQKYKELDRQYQFQAKMVDEFLSKLQELRIKESQNTFTWKLIEPPNLPIEPIGNSRIRGLVLGAIAGILSGVGIAFFLEKSDSRVRDVGDIQGFTQLPLLAVIPQFHFPLSLESVSDAFTESIRSLSLTLSFQNIQTSGQIIAITSATPGEGKTTITHHLGLALAELGKKVLIVDGNFANPKLHEIFSLPNHQGLTTLIATDRPWSEIIQSFPRKNAREEGANMGITNSLLIASNSKEGLNYLPNISGDGANNGKVHNNRMGNNSNSVCTEVSTRPVSEAQVPSSSSPVRKYPDILTSGPVGTNSFTWLIAPQIVKLLNSWIQAYDYVLFDTSSLTESADAQSISAQVDAVILVIGEKKVEKSMVMESLKILERNNSQGIGIVFNTLGTGKGRKPNKIYNSFSGND